MSRKEEKVIAMKKLIAIFTIGILIFAGTACQEELEERYPNPEETSNASIGKFFTKMLNNDRVRPSYWNVRTFLVMQPARYTQSASFTNSERRYQQQLSYIDDYWRDYYTSTGAGIIAHLREMEKTYSGLSSEGKAEADVFMQAAKVVVAEQTSKMVDLWGDLPFFDAGALNLTGDAKPPQFDDASEIYDALMDQLKEAADYFATAQLPSTVQAAFNKQDILLAGNLDKWRRYANSLRLRLLMRISFQNENKAQTDVMAMLNNPAQNPLVDTAIYNVLLMPLTNYNDNMRNALVEVTSHVAPEFLLDEVLKTTGDPRVRVWFDKNVRREGNNLIWNEDYFSLPSDLPSSQQDASISQGRFAVLDSTTFLLNRNFPGILITSSEVNLLKAEAYERWGNGALAKAAYEKGVADAVRFMFYLNQTNQQRPHEAAVTTEEISDLLSAPGVAYTGSENELLAKIWTQKWLSLGFIQSIENWAEVRRTKMPALTFVPDNTPGAALPPSRLVYPDSEKSYNQSNYAKVAANDKTDVKIFWDVK